MSSPLLAKSPADQLKAGRPLTLAGVPDGAEGLVVADLARAVAARKNPPAISLAVICRDGARMAAASRALSFFAPDIEVLEFPAWDCLPYDRVSPHRAVVAQRVMTLARLARVTGREHPAVLLTTVNAVLQRVPERAAIAKQSLSVAPGNVAPMANIIQWLELIGLTALPPCARPAIMQCAAVSSICSRPAWTARCGSIFSATQWNRSAVSIRRRSARPTSCARSIWS